MFPRAWENGSWSQVCSTQHILAPGFQTVLCVVFACVMPGTASWQRRPEAPQQMEAFQQQEGGHALSPSRPGSGTSPLILEGKGGSREQDAQGLAEGGTSTLAGISPQGWPLGAQRPDTALWLRPSTQPVTTGHAGAKHRAVLSTGSGSGIRSQVSPGHQGAIGENKVTRRNSPRRRKVSDSGPQGIILALAHAHAHARTSRTRAWSYFLCFQCKYYVRFGFFFLQP